MGAEVVEEPKPHQSAAPSVLTARDVGSMLKVSPKTVYKYKDCDGLPFHRFAGTIRFYESEVFEWVESKRTKTPERREYNDEALSQGE